jgi:hypothetical protein
MPYRHEQRKCPHVRRETQWGDAAKNLRRRADAKQAVAAKEDWKLRCLEKADKPGKTGTE